LARGAQQPRAMTRRRGIVVMVTAAWLAFLRGASASCPVRSPTVDDAVKATMASAEAQNAIGICVVGISGFASKAQCRGVRQFGSPLPVDEDTLFAIGSVTKTMTATMLALLVTGSSTSVSLDDPIECYEPYSVSNPGTITLQSLATHHSGLQRMPPTTASDMDDFYDILTDCTYDMGPVDTTSAPSGCWDPAQPYHYSNWGFYTIGNFLANLFVMPDWATVNSLFLMPALGMTKTMTFRQAALSVSGMIYFLDHYTVGHVLSGSTIMVEPPYSKDALEEGGGALYSSINEMTIWLKYNMGQTGPAAFLNLLPTLRNWYVDRDTWYQGIGLAWDIDLDTCEPKPQVRWSKEGSTGTQGNNAYIVYDYWSGRGAVVLVNTSTGIANAETIALKLFHLLP
jgi:CubicO group peptidase (beta-lactamase class C family)